MAYTKELIDEVKRLYPDYKEMHKMAENGDAFLGRYLDDSSSTAIAIPIVLNAKSLDELKSIAHKMQAKVDLYKKWCEQDPRKY